MPFPSSAHACINWNDRSIELPISALYKQLSKGHRVSGKREILHPCSQPGWADWMEHSKHSYMSFRGQYVKADIDTQQVDGNHSNHVHVQSKASNLGCT